MEDGNREVGRRESILRSVLRSAGFWILSVLLLLALFILIFESPWPAIVQVMYGITG